MTDMLVRGASLCILFIAFHQIFTSVGGSLRHKIVGTFGIIIGGYLAYLVSMRGAHHETLTTMYRLHLAFGAVFFFCLFCTGFTGWKARTHREYCDAHGEFGRATGMFLCASLATGIAAWFG